MKVEVEINKDEKYYRCKKSLERVPYFKLGTIIRLKEVDLLNKKAVFNLPNEEFHNDMLMGLDEFHKHFESAEEKTKPAHYDTPIDTIDFMKANFSREAVEGFMRGNAIKYLQRIGKGEKLSDLKKAEAYIKMLIELEDAK